MSDELRAAIETVQRHLAAAEEAGHPYEAILDRARLAELAAAAKRAEHDAGRRALQSAAARLVSS